MRPRSKCPKCQHQLTWYENIPVVSWVALRGKCSHCKAPISPRYVFVELGTGALFMAMLSRFDWSWSLVAGLTFVTVLIPLIFIDAEHWILPFELTLPGIALGLALQYPIGGWPAVQTGLIGAVAGFLVFRFMEFAGWAVVGREAMGAGDKFLVAMCGAFLGWRPLLGVVMLSALQGAVVGIVRMRLTGRAGPLVEGDPASPLGEAPAESKGEASSTDPSTGGETSETSEREPFTPAFLRPGLPFWKRLVLIPWTIFLQEIPDPPPVDEETGEEPEWVPGDSNIPFGPWIGLAALEVMLLGTWIAGALAQTRFGLTAELLFGG